MSRVKMFGAIPRRKDRTRQWFHDHYRHPHGTLGRLISTMRAYTQCHQFDSDLLGPHQAHFEATAEVWFDSVQDAIDFPTEPNYVKYLIPDEPLFVDMDELRFVFGNEEVLQSGVNWLDGRAEDGDKVFRLDRRPISVKLMQYIIEDGDSRWDAEEDLELGRRIGALRHVRSRPNPVLHEQGAFCLGVRELYWPTYTDLLEGVSRDKDAWDALVKRASKSIEYIGTAERFM